VHAVSIYNTISSAQFIDTPKLNKSIREMPKNNTLKFIPIDLETCEIYLHSDASLSNRLNLKTQAGFVIAIGEPIEKARQGRARCNIVDWRSASLKRVAPHFILLSNKIERRCACCVWTRACEMFGCLFQRLV